MEGDEEVDDKLVQQALKQNQKEAAVDDSLRVELPPLLESEKIDDSFLDTNRKGGHLTDDPILLRYQRSVIFSLMGSVGQTILQGKSLSTISLPVRIFEPRSYLQRITDAWGNIDFLKKAVETADPVERLKWTATFNISGLRFTVLQAKPFNPILGETFQATYPGGLSLYMEQVTHHPPASSWLMEDEKKSFRFYGSAEYQAAFRGNTIHAHQFGPQCLKFADGSYIEWTWPNLHMSGYIYGERRSNYTGTMIFRYPQYSLQLEVTFIFGQKGFWKSSFSAIGGWFSGNKKKDNPSDYFKGEIAQYSQFPKSSLFPTSRKQPSSSSTSTSSPSSPSTLSLSSPFPIITSSSPMPPSSSSPIPPLFSSSDSSSLSSTSSGSSSSSSSSSSFSEATLSPYPTSSCPSPLPSPVEVEFKYNLPPLPPNAQKKVLSLIEGTWLGYLDFDGKRYWDVRQCHPMSPTPVENPLPSDCRFRRDLQHLAKKELAEAQKAKEEMEDEQRLQKTWRTAGAKGAKGSNKQHRHEKGGGGGEE